MGDVLKNILLLLLLIMVALRIGTNDEEDEMREAPEVQRAQEAKIPVFRLSKHISYSQECAKSATQTY